MQDYVGMLDLQHLALGIFLNIKDVFDRIQLIAIK